MRETTDDRQPIDDRRQTVNHRQQDDKIYDYAIVGQGLSGSILAFMLVEQGKKVIIFNDNSLPSASSVAAGIYNPVTGKRLVKTWLADELLPVFVQFYKNLEKRFGVKFLHETNIYRPFGSIAEQNTFLAKTIAGEFPNYVNENHQKRYENQIFQNLGSISIKKSGWVDIPLMLEKLKSYLQENAQFVEEKFDFEKIIFQKNGLKYESEFLEKIIFCEGFHACQNPYFSWLPFTAAKGEILNVEIENYSISEILNQGIFILNQQNGTSRVGATYQWDNLNNEPSLEARKFLTERLDKILKLPYKIVSQQAGVRPATDDRRPFVGLHPQYPQLGILNGMGSKGVSLVPYFAQQFVDFLENKTEIQPEANIQRYYSLYFGK